MAGLLLSALSALSQPASSLFAPYVVEARRGEKRQGRTHMLVAVVPILKQGSVAPNTGLE